MKRGITAIAGLAAAVTAGAMLWPGGGSGGAGVEPGPIGGMTRSEIERRAREPLPGEIRDDEGMRTLYAHALASRPGDEGTEWLPYFGPATAAAQDGEELTLADTMAQRLVVQQEILAELRALRQEDITVTVEGPEIDLDPVVHRLDMLLAERHKDGTGFPSRRQTYVLIRTLKDLLAEVRDEPRREPQR